MNERPHMKDWEAQINALLDGELDDAGAQALKAAARGDQRLAAAIVEAYQLQQALSALPIERAPDSLRRKLRRIPQDHGTPWWAQLMQPRWVAAAAVLAIATLVAVTLRGPKPPSEAEIAQARHDLAIAFAYLDKVGERTGYEIQHTVNAGVSESVTEPVVKTITEQFEFSKEKEA
jgi:anti-sigma factor RsiW